MSFFPLFAAATHVLRLKAIEYRTVSVAVHIEQTEVSSEGVLNSPTRTIFSKTSVPIPTDRIPGFRAFAAREWLPILKNTDGRGTFAATAQNTPHWDVAMLQQCEGTMLVKDTSSAAASSSSSSTTTTRGDQKKYDDSSNSIPITIRAQIIGETDAGVSQVIGESGSQEIPAARVLLARKVIGLLLHTSAGDVGVVVSVAREDHNGCVQRVEQFLAQHSNLPAANAAGVARNLIKAANGDEIMVFCQLRKKFHLTDFDGRLARYMSLYSLDAPEDWEHTDAHFADQLLRDWAPTEELLFVALATMFGPEQDSLSSWIRFRAMNSVVSKNVPKDLYARWRRELRVILGRGDATDAELQTPVHSFFEHCCDEITATQEEFDSDNKFREPPPFLYLFDNDVRALLHIDSFGGFSQSALPGEVEDEANEKKNHDADAWSGLGVEGSGGARQVTRVRNSANMLIDVVAEGTQTKREEQPSVHSQCNFFEKPKTSNASTMAVEYKLTNDEFVQTNSDLYWRTIDTQTDDQEMTPTVDAEVDATEPVPQSTRETQTPAPLPKPQRTVKLSTVDDLPRVGFEHEILERDAEKRQQTERALDEHINARRRLEGELQERQLATEAARVRLGEEVDARQRLEQRIEELETEASEQNAVVQRLLAQSRLAEVERKDMADKREATRQKLTNMAEEIEQLSDAKKTLQGALDSAEHREEELRSDLTDVRANYESMKRQCDILSDDAKASRESSDKVFEQLKELENKLLEEKDTRIMYQEQVELAQKRDVGFGIQTSDSLLTRVKALEQEREDLLREKDQWLRGGGATPAAGGGATSAAGNNGPAAADEESLMMMDRVSQARSRLQKFRDGKRERSRERVAFKDQQQLVSPPYVTSSPTAADGNSSRFSERSRATSGGGGGSRLSRPHLPSSSASPIILVQQDDHDHHTTDNDERMNTASGSSSGGRTPPLARPGQRGFITSPEHHQQAAPSSSSARQLIEEGWANQRRGMTDAARACWEQAAKGSLRSAEEASQPMHIGTRYEAEGLLSEVVMHDAARAAEMYSMAIKYWPTQSAILRLAGLHDREENGDADVAVELYRLASSMGSHAARNRLAEMNVM